MMDPTAAAPPQFYTEAQNRALSIIPSIVGAISLCGSSLIIYIILKDRKRLLHPSRTYDRIMLGLSFFDILSSLGLTVFGPWSIPEEAFFVVGARAQSRLLCNLSGFATHMLVGSVLYTAALMIYFILLVKLEWRPERIAKRVEPLLHFVPFSVALSTGSLAVTRDFMNPMIEFPGVCWIVPYPPYCDILSEVPCLRGEGSITFIRGMAIAPMLTFVIVMVAMVLLVLKVRATEQRIARYQIGGGRNSATSFERTCRTAKRGLAYVGGFVISYLPTAVFMFVFRIRPIEKRGAGLFVAIVILVFLPMQGLFNAIIYLRPKWNELTQSGQSLHRLSRVLSWVGDQSMKKRRSGRAAARQQQDATLQTKDGDEDEDAHSPRHLVALEQKENQQVDKTSLGKNAAGEKTLLAPTEEGKIAPAGELPACSSPDTLPSQGHDDRLLLVPKDGTATAVQQQNEEISLEQEESFVADMNPEIAMERKDVSEHAEVVISPPPTATVPEQELEGQDPTLSKNSPTSAQTADE